MRIYIRTPLVNKSNIIPHTVEHCVATGDWNRSDFFNYWRGLEWEVKTDYTRFEFDEWIKYEDMLQILFQPIEKDTLVYEHKVLKEELSDPSYLQKIYEKVIKKFIDPDLTTNRYKSVPLDDVKDYHKKYYKSENLIVVDDEKDYKIVYKWFNPKENKSKKFEKKGWRFKYDGNGYFVYILNHCDWNHYRLWFFSYRLLNCHCYSINRLYKHWYYNQENYFFQYEDSCIVMLEDLDYSGITQEFFEQWKIYFLNILKYWYYKESFFLNEYIYWIPKTRKEAIQIVKDYSREKFKEFLELK